MFGPMKTHAARDRGNRKVAKCGERSRYAIIVTPSEFRRVTKRVPRRSCGNCRRLVDG